MFPRFIELTARRQRYTELHARAANLSPDEQTEYQLLVDTIGNIEDEYANIAYIISGYQQMITDITAIAETSANITHHGELSPGESMTMLVGAASNAQNSIFGLQERNHSVTVYTPITRTENIIRNVTHELTDPIELDSIPYFRELRTHRAEIITLLNTDLKKMSPNEIHNFYLLYRHVIDRYAAPPLFLSDSLLATYQHDYPECRNILTRDWAASANLSNMNLYDKCVDIKLYEIAYYPREHNNKYVTNSSRCTCNINDSNARIDKNNNMDIFLSDQYVSDPIIHYEIFPTHEFHAPGNQYICDYVHTGTDPDRVYAEVIPLDDTITFKENEITEPSIFFIQNFILSENIDMCIISELILTRIMHVFGLPLPARGHLNYVEKIKLLCSHIEHYMRTRPSQIRLVGAVVSGAIRYLYATAFIRPEFNTLADVCVPLSDDERNRLSREIFNPDGIPMPVESCRICLNDYESGEHLISLPCSHKFHVNCVFEWLNTSIYCPLCKANIKTALTSQ